MKNSYISAMSKISASDDLRAKTIAAMNTAKEKPANKTIQFNKKWAIVAACAVFVICVPTAIKMLDIGNGLITKNAEPQAQVQEGVSGAEERIATNREESNAAGEGGNAVDEGNKAIEGGAVGPRAVQFNAVPDILTQDDATALLNDGLAIIQGEKEAGGYETVDLTINSVDFDEETSTFRFNVTDNKGKKLILLVK